MDELRLRCFESNPDFNFIPEKDRSLFKKKTAMLKLGIIGTGTIGLEHIRVAGLEERAEIAGLFDLNSDVLAYAQKYTHDLFGYTPKIYKTLDQMAHDSELEGFVICTPNHQHLVIFEALQKTEKPFYIEKPMAHTLTQARSLYKLAIDHSAPVHIGLQYRFKPQYTELLTELQSPNVSAPHHIQILEHRPPFLDKVNQWNKYNHQSGGTLIEKCCHYFNLMQLIAGGPPTKVSCYAHQTHNFTEFDSNNPADGLDSAQVIVEFKNKVIAGLSLCMFAPSFYEELTVCSANTKLKASEESYPISQQPNTCTLEVLQSETLCSKKYNPSYGALISNSGHSGSTFKAHEVFVDQLLAFYGREIDPSSKKASSFSNATLKEALWSIVIGHAAQEAAKKGTVIAVSDIIRDYDLEFLLEADS